jgi:hypothetical protein
MRANERNKAARLEQGGGGFTAHAFDELQFLILDASDGYHHSAAFGKLREKRSGRRGCRSGHEDRIKRRELRQAKRAVATMDVNIGVTQARETLRGTRW